MPMINCYQVLLGLTTLMLTGCFFQATDQQLDVTTDQVKARLDQTKLPTDPVHSSPLEIIARPWLGHKAVRLQHGLPLPVSLERSRAVSWRTALPQNLYQIAEMITQDLGVPVRIDQLNLPQARQGQAGIDPAHWTIPIAYEGTLSGFLNSIIPQFDLAWYYNGTELTFYRYETKVFVIESLPGVQSMVDGLASSQVGESKGSESSSSASRDATQRAELTITLEFWTELTKTLETMLGGDGGVSISPSSGTVTVTTTPVKMRQVTRYLQDENKRLSKQAAITVEIWSVSLSDADSYGTDLKALFVEGQGLTYALQGTPTLAENQAGSLAVSILNPASSRALKKFDGSRLAFEALSSLGKVTRLARIPVTALNNRPATRKIAIDTAYLESTTTTMVPNAASQTSLKPGLVSSGIILQLLPRILDDGRIILQYSLNISELITLRSFGSEDNQIQLPEQTKRLFVQQSTLRHGSTLVLSGFEQDQLSLNSQGLGHEWNLLMGGAKRQHNKEMIVIAITPHIVSDDGHRKEGD